MVFNYERNTELTKLRFVIITFFHLIAFPVFITFPVFFSRFSRFCTYVIKTEKVARSTELCYFLVPLDIYFIFKKYDSCRNSKTNV